MYIWQFQYHDRYTVIGRTWDEFLYFVRNITLHLPPKVRLVVYVHNLSYEFQFLKGIYHFESDDVFALKPRKVAKALMMGLIEFRCSYLQTNMSLEAFTKKMGIEHAKKHGYDYRKIRYPWTELSQDEIDYCVHDVKGLVEAMDVRMRLDGDTLKTIPLTSTGYVRRDAKHAMREIRYGTVTEQLPDYGLYTLLREAFRGGNTHASRFYAGEIIGNVHSFDRSSSYPDVICNCKFPVTRFVKVENIKLEYAMELMTLLGHAAVFRVAFEDVRLCDIGWGCPYLSRSKCRHIRGGIYDNGRVLSADYLETTLTDVDFKIILQEYHFSRIGIGEFYHARYGYLPKPLCNLTIEYYKNKTELKGVEGQELYYDKSKNLLNSIYGMMAQDPVKQTILFLQQMFQEDNIEERLLLEKYNHHAFLCYQWGCWVTAWSRYRLEEGIIIAGDGFVYCDTDSVKYTGEVNWSDYNNQRIADSMKSGAYATDPRGITHYMGVYEQEKDYDRFITLGAKKYAFEIGGKLGITVAGVSKKIGGNELANAGGLEAFKPGFIFAEAGGLEARYNDFPEINKLDVDGKILRITSNVALLPSTYQLGITDEYNFTLKDAQRVLQNWGLYDRI